MTEALVLEDVSKRFGRTVAVDCVDLRLADGELLALVGPSGCGKSTLLRVVAGLERADSGSVVLGGVTVDDGRHQVPPERRHIGLVFQEHALFPHLDVAGNVSFGLRDGWSSAQRRERVAEVLDLVGLGAYGGRYVHELSGGERQRVALARALAPRPSLLLLDEPFASLDPNRRHQVRADVVRILKATGTPGVFVTHDQLEALAVGDRVAVMDEGRIAEVGSPHDVFHRPANRFVAVFMGEADFLPVADPAGAPSTVLGPLDTGPVHAGAVAMVRPDDITFVPDPTGEAEVVDREFLGSAWRYELRLDSGITLRSVQSHLVDVPTTTRVRPSLSRGHRPGRAPTRAVTWSADVVVVGGGPAGLALADALALRASVVLLEASDRVGGMAASTVVGGQRVDLGSHRLHPSTSTPVRRLVDDLLGDDLQERRRHGRIRLAGRWVGFPLRTGDLLRSLPPSFAARAIRDTLVAPMRRPRADTYAEVVHAGLGPAALATFHGPYARKLWGVPPEELAGELARRRISVSGPLDMVRTLAQGARRGGKTFLYPRHGYGEIVERLGERATQRGADLRSGARPVAVLPSVGGVTVELDGGEQIEAGRVFWTAPAAALAATVPGAPMHDAMVSRHRGLVLVYLVLDRDRFTEFDAHYLPGLDLAAARISEPKNYRDGPDPSGRTVLCAEVPADEGDDRWAMTDDELVDVVRRDLVRCGLPAPVPVEAATIRLPRVYPIVRVDDVDSRARLAEWADSLPRVHVLGRQGLVVADNLHHVLAMALDAAGCVGQDGSWDAATWSAARAGWASHVVED